VAESVADLDNVDGRYDFDALMSWEIRNLGFGERAARRESNARVQQAKFEKLRIMDQVAEEISTITQPDPFSNRADSDHSNGDSNR